MIKTPTSPQKAAHSDIFEAASLRTLKAAVPNGGIASSVGGIRGGSGNFSSGGRYINGMSGSSLSGIKYCRLVTDAVDSNGCPVRCYSVLCFVIEDHVVLDYTFIFDVTRRRVRFERLIRAARREQLMPDQLRYLVEDMTAAGLL